MNIGRHNFNCCEKPIEDHLGWSIIYDLCVDLPYNLIFDNFEIIVDPSDGTKQKRNKRSHIFVYVELHNARIVLRSMADYARSSIYAFVELNNPDYEKEFLDALDRIIKMRRTQFFIEEPNYNNFDKVITKESIEEIKKILLGD